ncbi:cytochrome P450 [Pisolithus orientalis]|uniref:cytochrome P450 n=1 Tax=Pisolithus orientalis TaxID=936130 RepID=UPI00222440F4|nr:cytochrome P450 [Pisolithus orientalis]KAI5999861.1 cytochrome P450 [Pisolithus orientalis]
MDISPTKHIFAATICATVPAVALKLWKSSNLDHIPSVGYSSWLGSYISAFKYVGNAVQILQEGYAKYKETPFKVPTLNRWIVIIGRRHLEDIKKSTDDELSLIEAANEVAKVDHLIGREINSNPYHSSVARIHLTRNIGLYYPDIKDEVHTAFEELLDLKDNVWKSVPAVEIMREIVCRTSNRVFVGLPLCRDPDWIDLNSQFAVDVATDANILNMFPKLLVPFVSKILPNTAAGIERAIKHLDPIIKDRLRRMRDHGDEWSDKPNDILQWLIDAKQESTTRQLTLRVLTINFASIHSTTNALYNLAAYSQYVGPLREEVDAVIREHGWTKEALALMYRVDSFLAETQRLEGLSVPVYENPDAFDPFRFSQLRVDGNESGRHQMVAVNQDYFPFGYGKHACPGRFLAANELKTMLAYILTMYDVKFEDSVSRPASIHWDLNVMADPTVRVMFRKRVI